MTSKKVEEEVTKEETALLTNLETLTKALHIVETPQKVVIISQVEGMRGVVMTTKSTNLHPTTETNRVEVETVATVEDAPKSDPAIGTTSNPLHLINHPDTLIMPQIGIREVNINLLGIKTILVVVTLSLIILNQRD
jgi:hypothetical protein